MYNYLFAKSGIEWILSTADKRYAVYELCLLGWVDVSCRIFPIPDLKKYYSTVDSSKFKFKSKFKSEIRRILDSKLTGGRASVIFVT